MEILIASAVAVLVIAGVLYFAVRKEIPAIRRAWRSLSAWERYALISGLVLYLGLPVVQAAAAPKYLVDVSSKLIEAIGNGLFLLGLLSFLQKLHAPAATTSVPSPPAALPPVPSPAHVAVAPPDQSLMDAPALAPEPIPAQVHSSRGDAGS